VPTVGGDLVGLVEWVGVERSPFPKRPGLKDFGLVDLPYPIRKMVLNPVGMLVRDGRDSETPAYRLERGVTSFPSVGDPVVLPSIIEQRAIVEAHGRDARVEIGESTLAPGAKVSIDPDKLFGRHLAVLGNTGGGKSCSVAGLIRWSIESAGRNGPSTGQPVNARFIVLDPNGEYAAAFADLSPPPRVFRVPPVTAPDRPLRVPAWLWNSHEWASFAAASSGTQRPILLQALRELRGDTEQVDRFPGRVHLRARTSAWHVENLRNQGTSGYTGFPACKNCGEFLARLVEDLESYAADAKGDLAQQLRATRAGISSILSRRYWESGAKSGFNDFAETDLAEAQRLLEELTRAINLNDPRIASEDAPIPFDLDTLGDHLEFLASHVAGGLASQWVSLLAMRVRMLLADRRLGPVLQPSEEPALDEWLAEYVGESGAENGQVAILDLSLVPSDVIHTVVAVVGRLVFEALQRVRRDANVELPTVLVLEEAHSFISRSAYSGEDGNTAEVMCRNTFSRIAREGRKFGLGLTLSSQRPAELEPTILAQCNTFLLHRLANDRDQDLVRRLVPDNLGGLLGELPSLPTQHAILLGWSVPMPMLFRVRDLPEEARPRSADPNFWKVWTGEQSADVEWEGIAAQWQGSAPGNDDEAAHNPTPGPQD
jgi:uncharacterized protein